MIEGKVRFGGYETWYTLFGKLSKEGQPPLVVLHGGPGSGHNYLLPLSKLAQTHGCPVVLYNQLGCGNSTHLREKPESFWTIELLLEQLDNLLQSLKIKKYDVLGHSWGGMLAAEHAVRQPKGLRRLVLSNSPASISLWLEEMRKLLNVLPATIGDKILQHEADDTTDSPDHEAALDVYNSKHQCRKVPIPAELLATMEVMKQDPTVDYAMYGKAQFRVTGALKHWSIIDRLRAVTVPTLVINGRYDAATFAAIKPYLDEVRSSIWSSFWESSHTPHLEETEEYLAVVGRFLMSSPFDGRADEV